LNQSWPVQRVANRAQAVDVGGIKVLAVKLEDVDSKSLKDMAEQLKNKLGSSAIVLAVVMVTSKFGRRCL